MNMVMIYDYADRLNSAKKIEECRNIAATAFAGCSDDDIKEIGGVSEYYDTAVTIFVMAINRSLSFAMDIDKTSLDFYDLVDANAAEAEKVFREFVDGLEDCEFEDYSVFREYLNKIAEYILKNYNDHPKPVTNVYNICRNIALSINMKEIICRNNFDVSMIPFNKFTKKYNIQIPYIYVCTNELYYNSIKSIKKDYSDSANQSSGNSQNDDTVLWLETCIGALRNRELLDIMRWRSISSYPKNLSDNKVRRDNLTIASNFNFLLPHMEYNDKKFSTIQDTFEGYCSIPFIPAILPNATKSYATSLIDAEVRMTDIIEDKNKELEKTNQALKKEQEEKEHIVHEFRHTYGNMTSYGLQAIADKLLSNPDKEIKALGRQAMMELSIKKDLSSAIEMLVWKIDGDRRKLREQVHEGISTVPRDGYQTIYEVADEAMKRIMLRIFYDQSKDGKLWEGKDNISRLLGVDDLKDAMDEFEDNIFSQNCFVAEWLQSKGLKLELSVDGGFEKLFFEKDSYSELFFKDIISECFFNMVKYSDFTKPLSIKFTSEGNRYIISFENTPSEYAYKFIPGDGLTSKKEIICMLSENSGKMVSEFGWSKQPDKFNTQAFFEKDFLEGRI